MHIVFYWWATMLHGSYIVFSEDRDRRTGQVSFRGEGAEVNLPKHFLYCLHDNQVDLPEYYLIFCPKMAIYKILGGLQPPSAPYGPYTYEDQVWNFIDCLCKVCFSHLKCPILKHKDSFGKEKNKNKTCSIFDKTLSKVFLNNFHALNRS